MTVSPDVATGGLTKLAVRAMLATFAFGLWVLGLVAERPTAGRVLLVAAMAVGLVPLFALSSARRVLALALPPLWVIVAVAAVVLAAIAALTLWQLYGRLR